MSFGPHTSVGTQQAYNIWYRCDCIGYLLRDLYRLNSLYVCVCRALCLAGQTGTLTLPGLFKLWQQGHQFIPEYPCSGTPWEGGWIITDSMRDAGSTKLLEKTPVLAWR